MKPRYEQQIDDGASRVRQKYLSAGVGMTLTYQEKLAQAKAVDAIGEAAANALTPEQARSQYPTLAASVGIEADTLFACAGLVLQKYAQFAQLSFAIERKRLQAKKAIRNAQTEDDLKTIVAATRWGI